MKHFLLTLFVLFLSSPCYSQESIVKVKNPVEVRTELRGSTGVPKEIEGLQWNRWVSKNFVVCSLDDTQAQYLHKHLELVKNWTFTRWGLTDLDFSVECKVIVVDKPDLYKKLFNLDGTRVEIHRDSNGKITSTVIFMLCNDSPSKVIPMPLTQVCLAEYSQKNKLKMGLWAYRGMSILNTNIPQIKENLLTLKNTVDKNEPMFFSKGLLEMDADQYTKLDDSKKQLYDNCAMAFCLMMRKEYGEDKYILFLKRSNDNYEVNLKQIIGFDNYDQFDKTFKRYLVDIMRDISSGKTPDNYLQIREKK